MRRVMVGALTMMALVALAVPAGAHGSDTGVFQATTVMGSTWDRPCDGEGNGRIDPAGGGLRLPDPLRPSTARGWHLVADTAVGMVHGFARLQLCGALSSDPVTGMGAACGLSSGDDGRGLLVSGGAAHPASTLRLEDVGWVATLGSIVPITGSVESHEGDGGNGTFLALAQMHPGAGCLASEQGASQFATTATFMVLAH